MQKQNYISIAEASARSALTRDGSDTESLADDIEDNYQALVTRYGQQELLDVIGPALERADE